MLAGYCSLDARAVRERTRTGNVFITEGLASCENLP